jgi:hypothetical protein
LGFQILDLDFGFWILEFRFGFWIWDLGFGILDFGFGIWDLRFDVFGQKVMKMLIFHCVFKDFGPKVVIWCEVLTKSSNFTRCF